jgi:hypothetical protein
MTAAYFEDHPTDPEKVILRKKPYLDKGRDYEEGFIDGMQHQMKSSVDKAVNAMAQPEQERNFCQRCGKRLGSNYWDVHTCTPPQPEYQSTADKSKLEKVPAKGTLLAQQCICGEPNSAGTHRTDGPCLAPQRIWVGLTPQERDEINEQVYGAVPHHVAFHAAIEAKLKEKNNG